MKFKNMASEPFNADSQGGWAAMVEHYFGAWVPSARLITIFIHKCTITSITVLVLQDR